jgi:hypothetical protein
LISAKLYDQKKLLSYGEDRKGRKSSVQLKLTLLRGVETTLQTQQPVELIIIKRRLRLFEVLVRGKGEVLT